MVTDEVYERKDWISSGSERSIQEPLQKNEKISIFEDVSHKPYIFWSFMAMKSIFKTSRKFELANPLEFVADSLRRLHLPDTSQYDPVEELSSPAMIARLFKIANRSANTSLNYCLFSICNDAFNRLNRKMTTVNAVLQDPHAQFMLQVVTDSELSTGSLHIAPLLRQWEKQLFHEANGYHDALTLMTYPSMSKNKPPNCTFQQFPNHPLGGFTPEYKVLRICSAKLLTESAHYRLNSRYTRELFQFLLEVNTLQGLVLAFSKKMNYNIPLNLLHEDIVNDWRVASESNLMPNLPGKSSELPVKAESMDHNPDDHQDNDESPLTLLKDSKKSSSFLRSAQATSSINTATLSSTNLTKGRLPIPTISVTHVTSTSLVVSWANIPEDEDWNSAVQRAAVAASSSTPANVPVVAGANTTSTGISLSASVGGLLASIKGTLSNSQPNHTSYSLYITPIYRTLSLSCSGIALPEQSTDIKALRNAAEPSLVMPFVTPSGSHKIDLLDPDTLYRVSLVSDEDGTSFIVTPPESLSKQPSNKSFTTWGTNLLRGKKDSNNPATLLSTTGPVKVSSSLDDVKSFKTINSSKSNIDDNMVENLSKETIQPSDGKDKDEEGKPASLLSERTSCTDPFEKQIATMVSTVTEPLILLDGAVGLCPPQLKVTHHGLTVRNTINKKWSTVRSTSRLTTGVHQWEIFIDRCISKNIFIGVVGPEARTDNYVGCDKHGWAFLANRAVWFNKGKLKSYGELFRTGDVVQVTLDLDVGGSLSFSINGKDLGVAVEGLTGPLYPAFSLYNENDKISLSPPRQPQFVCSMDRCVDDSNLEATLAKMVYDTEGLNESRTGNSGTSNAERVVQRLDVVQSLYRFIVAGNVYRGAAAAKSSIPIFMPKTFLTPPLLTELTLKWRLWRQNVTLRTVRVQNGEIITIMVSSLQTLGMSDNRYCPGDLVQWEQHQFVVLGVGRHRLWFQKTSGNGDVIGFTKEFLHALHVKNSIRLVKKRSTLHRARAEKNKSDFTPSVLPTSLSASSLQSQTPLECHDEVLSSQGVPEVDKAAGIYRLCDFTESDFDNQSTLYVALINEADKWTQLEDSCLLEWLELRARVVGTHPLNMTLEQVISPTDAVGVLHSCGYVSSESDYCIGSLSTGSSSTLTATAFIRRFEPLLSKSLISIRLRSLLLLHLNDTLSPLLNVVYDPSGVDDDEGINIPYDLMSPLNTTILANRHLILLEVKFSYGFRLGWSTAMSQSMLDGGANSVTSMFQKKKAILERKHLSSYQDTSPVTRTSVDDDISFSTCPSELPLLPYRSFPPRGNSANFNLKTTEDSTLSNICTFNLLNNPLHPLSFNAGVNTKTRVTSSSQTKPSVVEGTTLDRLSVYYFEDATSCFLNWSTSSVVTSSASTPTAASSVPTQLPVSSTNNILGLPVINMFVVEQQRLHRGVLENSKKYQLQQVFEDDYRWHLLSNFQSSLLGQFMQTLERLNVQQLMSSKPPAGAAAGTDSDPANAPLENATVFSQVAPQGPWHGVLRSVFRAGMFWDDHMSPSSRPVSIYVHFLPQQYDGMKKEHRMSKKDRVNGSVDSACSGTTLTPRQAPAQNSSFRSHTPHYDTIPESDASSPSNKIFDDKKEKEKAEILRSLSLPPPPTGQQVPGASQLAMSRLQRTIHLLQANFSKLVDGTPTAVVSPWTSLQMYIVEAVSEVQPLLASSLLSNEENFYVMEVSEIDLLARNDVLCQFLAKHAKISDTIQESTGSSSLAGVINLHLHVMHSLGVLLGVALRHGISTNIRMSNYFWRLLSRASVSPYFCTPEFGNETTHKSVDGKPGQRLQELYSGVRESCGRALRHGIVSIIPEGFLNLLQEGELRVLLSGGGSSCVELLRSVASYTKPVLASDMHIEMFWIAFNDLPPTAVNRFLHCLWGSARIEKDNTGVMFPEELFYWKQTPTVLGKIIFADIPTQTTDSPEPNNSNNLLGETDNRIHNGTQLVDIQLIYISDHHVVHLPRYSNLDLMRAKLKDFIDSL